MIATHVGREQTIEACGRVWRVSRWTRSVWSEYLTWARGVRPDPVEVALKHLDQVPERLQAHWVRMALDKKTCYLSVSSPEVQSLLSSLEGTVQLLWLLLKPYQPDVTLDHAFEVAISVGEQELDKLLTRAAGENKEGEAPAPVK